MKILQLCKKFPFPLKDGESIAVTTLSKALNELDCEVSLLAMNTRKHYYEVANLPSDFNHYREIYTVDVDNRVKPFDAFVNLFLPDSYHISRFISPVFEEKLISLLARKDYDLVQLETLYLAPYIPLIRKYSDAIVAMRAHNVEHEIWRRITRNTRFLPKRWYLNHLTRKLKRFEAESLKKYDILVAITQRDLQTFRALGYQNTGVVTPIGIRSDDYLPDYESYRRGLSVAFIGSLDWMPNQEGLLWFLEKVWSKLPPNLFGLTLHVAGRNTPDWLHQLKMKNVVIHGEVPCASHFVNQHSLMVVPLLSGSGMRAKILEGMALGKVIITTSMGLEGIAARPGEELLVANTPDEFIASLRHCYEKRSMLEAMGRKAKHFVSLSYDSREIAGRLLEAYASLTVEAI